KKWSKPPTRWFATPRSSKRFTPPTSSAPRPSFWTRKSGCGRNRTGRPRDMTDLPRDNRSEGSPAGVHIGSTGAGIVRKLRDFLHQQRKQRSSVAFSREFVGVGGGPFERLDQHDRALLQAGDLFREGPEQFAHMERRFETVDGDLEQPFAI